MSRVAFDRWGVCEPLGMTVIPSCPRICFILKQDFKTKQLQKQIYLVLITV